MIPKTHCIYGLFDPRSDELRYVGYTSKPLNARLRGHINDSKREFTHKSNWIKLLLKSGLKPSIDILQETNENKWVFDEQWNIAYFRSIGCSLTNDPKCPGGEKPPNLLGIKKSPETKAKMSLSQMGNKNNLGHIIPLDVRNKISKANSGKKRTPEQNVTASIVHSGIKRTEDANAKTSITASKLTYEVVRQIRQMAQDGNIHKVIGLEFGISKSCVRSIIIGKTYRHYT